MDKLGVTAVPTFVTGRYGVVGAQPYDMLEVIRCIVDYGEFVQVQEPSDLLLIVDTRYYPVGGLEPRRQSHDEAFG